METEWEDQGASAGGGEFHTLMHVRCGAKLLAVAGAPLICPRCQPAEFADKDRVGRELRDHMRKVHDEFARFGYGWRRGGEE
jgi:hypothetical protein